MRFRSIVSSGLFLLGTTHFGSASPQAPIENVLCPREGKSFILYIVPEGASVTKGQLLCSLGPAESLASIQLQRISVRQTEASYQQSKHAREAAEVAVREYEERTFKNQVEKAERDIALAEAELERANDRLEFTRNRLVKGIVSPAQLRFDTLAVNKAKTVLQETNSRKQMLVEFTKEKTIKKLRADVEKFRVEELSRKLTYEREKAKEDRLLRQIPNVQILAPMDGSVRHARPSSLVEQGAEVRKGQLLLQIMPGSKVTPAKP
jgi:HlyD family secretion protein